MNKEKNIIIAIILFTGIFLFKMPFEKDLSVTPQIVYLIFSAGILGSLCLFRLNKYISLLFAVAVLMTCKTYLGERASRLFLLENIVIGSSMFCIYYATRTLNIRQSMLKFLIFPALVNCAFIFIQKFLPGLLPIPKGIYGILGGGGFTSCYLAVCVPIFYKYLKLGLIPLFYAIILCDGSVGFIAAIIGLLFMIFTDSKIRNNKVINVSLLIIIAIVAFLAVITHTIHISEIDFNTRISVYLGTLDGIMYHPITGWGLGSFVSIMSRVKPENSLYYKIPFNDTERVMNHPHNEFLYLWWSLGLFFIIALFFLIRDYIKKIDKSNMLSFAILLIFFIAMCGYEIKPPMMFILMLTMGIFENEYHINKEIFTDARA